MDSTQNIARRYRHLFRLPSFRRSIIYASIPVITIEVISRVSSGSGLLLVAFYAFATELLLLISVELDHRILRSITKLAIFRRLAALSIICNSIWLLITIFASLLFAITRSEGQFIALITLGMFFAISFRGLVFGTVFFERPWQALPLAATQPIVLILPIAFLSGKVTLLATNMITSVVGGLISVVSVEFYIAAVNKRADFQGFKPLELFQAFLKAWILEDATTLEHFLDIVGKDRVVITTMAKIGPISKQFASALLIVPGIHPGPFYPVGSSNLPSDIYARLRDDSTVPLTVHSISDHDLNLSSKSEVDRYVNSLKTDNVLGQGKTISLPVVKRKDKATVSGLALGSSILIALTLAPYGMEDFPVEVRNEIEKIAQDNGFKCEFIIDTHNSEGAKPTASDCQDTVNAARELVEELKSAAQYGFRAGLAHSSEISKTSPDIGPAGVGLIRFEVEDVSFCLLVVDANNSKLGFREEVFEKFERLTGSRILELCTSDTHVTAAKISEAKGYLALGDATSSDDFVTMLIALDRKSRLNTSEGAHVSSKVRSSVKTIGAEVLNEFSSLLDRTSRTSKNGALALALVTVLVVVAVSVV